MSHVTQPGPGTDKYFGERSNQTTRAKELLSVFCLFFPPFFSCFLSIVEALGLLSERLEIGGMVNRVLLISREPA